MLQVCARVRLSERKLQPAGRAAPPGILYPGEEGQDCSSTSWRQHNRRRADVWSSDDEETAGREGNPPPLAGEDLLQLETLLA